MSEEKKVTLDVTARRRATAIITIPKGPGPASLCMTSDLPPGYHRVYTIPPPAVNVAALSGWIADGDTIPDGLIEEARQAIRIEFGNNGTDGYYKRILVRVFRAILAQQPGVR